jgi:hypothetical protein
VPSAASNIVFHEVFMDRHCAEWAGFSMHSAWYASDIEVTNQVIKRNGFT